VGRRTGPLTLSFLSLARLTRSTQTAKRGVRQTFVLHNTRHTLLNVLDVAAGEGNADLVEDLGIRFALETGLLGRGGGNSSGRHDFVFRVGGVGVGKISGEPRRDLWGGRGFFGTNTKKEKGGWTMCFGTRVTTGVAILAHTRG